MEKKLKVLFDYQHFERNAHLAKLISETESQYARELSDEDLTLVNAAGELDMIGAATRQSTDSTEPSKFNPHE